MNKDCFTNYLARVAALVVFGVLSSVVLPRQAVHSLPNPTKLKVGIIPITDCAQLYVAKQMEIFARHGLDIDLIPMAGGSQILQALSTGAVDIAFSNLASAVFYEKNAGKLQRLAGGTFMDAEFSEAGLVVLANSPSPITNLQELKGKTIAVNTRKNIVDLAVLRALRKHKIAATEVNLVELPFKDMEAALRAGRIDAATLPEPILSRAIAAGNLKTLGDHFALAFEEIYSTGYFTSPQQFSSRQGVFDRFNQAIREATPIANEYGPKVITAISQVIKVAEVDLQRSGRPRFVGEIPDSALDQMKTWLCEEGYLEC